MYTYTDCKSAFSVMSHVWIKVNCQTQNAKLQSDMCIHTHIQTATQHSERWVAFYICVYIHIYIYTYTHCNSAFKMLNCSVYMRIYTRIQTATQHSESYPTYIYVYVYIYTYTCICVHIHIYISICICVYVHIYMSHIWIKVNCQTRQVRLGTWLVICAIYTSKVYRSPVWLLSQSRVMTRHICVHELGSDSGQTRYLCDIHV